MKSIFLFILAGLFEIGGGYLVWIWLRESRPIWMGIVGFILLALYGVIPIFQPAHHPFGRVYAAYGAVFIILSVAWGYLIDKAAPDRLDLIGASICLVGATLMMWPRVS